MQPPIQEIPSDLTGHLLLADPSLQDHLFKKSAVLISEYDKAQGASGFILNHPTAQTVGDLLTNKAFSDLRQLPVHLGGPVDQQSLIFVSFWAYKNSVLKYATRISAQKAIESIHQPGTLVRAFAGHSSWTQGQLEEELESHSWVITPANTQLLQLSHERSLWANALRTISPYHQVLAEAPDDIFIN